MYAEITLDQAQRDEQSEPEEESTEHSETSSASTHLCELQGMNMLVNILTVPRLLRRHLDHSLPKWLNDLQFLIHRFQKKWNP